MCFNLVFHHIPGVKNQIADCLSRLTRRIHEVILLLKKVAIKIRVECDDPWVENLAVSAMADADYMVMVSHIELGTEVNEMPQECELSKLSSCYKKLSNLTLKGGKTLVPKSEGENILQIAHQTHLRQEQTKPKFSAEIWLKAEIRFRFGQNRTPFYKFRF